MSRAVTIAGKVLRRRDVGLVVLIALVTLVVSLVDANFLAAENLRDILVRAAPTVIVACGLMLVVVTGEIDISVGSLMALLAALMGVTLSVHHGRWPIVPGVVTLLATGSLMGLGTGLLVTLGRVPSIIVTLGLLTGLRGATTLLMRGENIDGLPPALQAITKEGILGLPIGVWVAGVVIALTALIIHHLPLGRRLFALGSSPHSARLVGLSATRLKLFVFAYTGFLTAVATLVDVPRLPKIEAGIGSGFELLVVTCVVVGGVSISGGRGKLRGVLLAVLLLTMVRPVLTFLDIGEEGEKWTKAIQGAFILLAVVSDTIATQRRAIR
jgi:ribose/xylose/arabinose/galactoside ABC-type transport system permease subunit